MATRFLLLSDLASDAVQATAVSRILGRMGYQVTLAGKAAFGANGAAQVTALQAAIGPGNTYAGCIYNYPQCTGDADARTILGGTYDVPLGVTHPRYCQDTGGYRSGMTARTALDAESILVSDYHGAAGVTEEDLYGTGAYNTTDTMTIAADAATVTGYHLYAANSDGKAVLWRCGSVYYAGPYEMTFSVPWLLTRMGLTAPKPVIWYLMLDAGNEVGVTAQAVNDLAAGLRTFGGQALVGYDHSKNGGTFPAGVLEAYLANSDVFGGRFSHMTHEVAVDSRDWWSDDTDYATAAAKLAAYDAQCATMATEYAAKTINIDPGIVDLHRFGLYGSARHAATCEGRKALSSRGVKVLRGEIQNPTGTTLGSTNLGGIGRIVARSSDPAYPNPIAIVGDNEPAVTTFTSPVTATKMQPQSSLPQLYFGRKVKLLTCHMDQMSGTTVLGTKAAMVMAYYFLPVLRACYPNVRFARFMDYEKLWPGR